MSQQEGESGGAQDAENPSQEVAGGSTQECDGEHQERDISDDSSWPDATTAKIIEMWRDRPLLYDVSHPNYLNRDKKHKALSEIALEVKITGNYYMINMSKVSLLYYSL
jgi:hypothetical protein